MTTMDQFEMECSVCGKKSSHFVILSTNSMGYADLDLRPPEMKRSTMHTWVLECPHCGYVAENLENELQIDKEFLKTDRYLNYDGIEFKGKLSGRFYRRFLICNEMNDTEGSFYHLHHCAWDCDDKDDVENARKIRKLAIEYLDKLISQESDRYNDFFLVKADLLRRSGQFDKLNEFRDIIIGEEIYDKILTFQIQKANLGDDGCYTIEDVLDS